MSEFSLTKSDKRVIRAFASRMPDASKLLASDGTRLDGLFMGGGGLAHWSGSKLHLPESGGKISESIQRAVSRAVAPMDIAAGSQWILSEATRKRIAKRNPAKLKDATAPTVGASGSAAVRLDDGTMQVITRPAGYGNAKLVDGLAVFAGVHVRGYACSDRRGGLHFRASRGAAIAAAKAGDVKANPAYAGRLFDYKTGDYVGPATAAQVRASKAAAKRDGGAGVIVVNMRSVWAEESPKKAKRNPSNSQSAYYVVDGDGEHVRESRTIAAARRFAQSRANATSRTIYIQRHNGAAVETIHPKAKRNPGHYPARIQREIDHLPKAYRSMFGSDLRAARDAAYAAAQTAGTGVGADLYRIADMLGSKRNPSPRASKAGGGPRHGSGPERYYISDTTAQHHARILAPMTDENDHAGARLYIATSVLASPTFTEKVRDGNARMDRSHTSAHYTDNEAAWKANHALLKRMLAQVKRRTSAAGYAAIHGAL